MTATHLLELSPTLEEASLLLVLVGAAALVVARIRSHGRGLKICADSLPGWFEAACLLVILLAAGLARILWYAASDTPRWYFPETTSLWVAKAFEPGDLWRQWIALLHVTQVMWVRESAVMMPVAAAFQVVLGPSLHLPTLVGAFWGTLAVLLAWLLGRAVNSPAFGLVFAAFVAGSPLQIAWSRLGGIQIGAGTHALLALWLAYLAGRRRSLLLVPVAATAAFATLYHYYAARVALPLAFLALVAGLVRSRPGAGGALRRLAAFALIVAALFGLAHRATLWETLWPTYNLYLGSRGEKGPADFVAGAVDVVRREFPTAVRRYFWKERTFDALFGTTPTGADGTALMPGMRSGGLCLLPVGILGGIGLIAGVFRWKRDFLWLALAGLGFLTPCLSMTSARRFLVFDLAWCALAASGLLGVLESRWLAGLAPRRAASLALTLAMVLGAYAFGTVIALDAALPPYQFAVIPFAESGFGDGRTCLGCARTALAWQDEIRRGAFVVAFDTDLYREDRTVPGGLWLYGKVGALAAGKADNFLEYYSLVTNFDVEPPRTGPYYDPARTDFAADLAERIERARPERILWYFAQPTEWERWLADRLEAVGGRRSTLDEPSLVLRKLPQQSPAIQISTSWAQRVDALRVFAELAAATRDDPRCLRVERVATDSTPNLPLVLAARSPPADDARPRWAVASWHTTRYEDRDVPAGEAMALGFETPPDGASRLHLLARYGGHTIYAPATRQVLGGASAPGPVGYGCAALLGQDWWVVDPISGRVSTSATGNWKPPEGPWFGIAAAGEAKLILASAEQSLHLFDLELGREIAHFPAVVPPARRSRFGDCPAILWGDGWVATFNHLSSALAVYDPGGRPLGTVRVDHAVGITNQGIAGVGAAGRYLGVGVGADNKIETLKLIVAPECE